MFCCARDRRLHFRELGSGGGTTEKPGGLQQLLSVELRLLLLLASILAAQGLIGIASAQYIIHSFCLDPALVQTITSTGSPDCKSPAVTAKTAMFMRGLSIGGAIVAMVATPFLGMYSDALKGRDKLNPSARVPLLLCQLTALSATPLIYFAQLSFGLPRWVLYSSIISSSLGGTIGLLPTLFALRADMCAPGQRETAFLRVRAARSELKSVHFSSKGPIYTVCYSCGL